VARAPPVELPYGHNSGVFHFFYGGNSRDSAYAGDVEAEAFSSPQVRSGSSVAMRNPPPTTPRWKTTIPSRVVCQSTLPYLARNRREIVKRVLLAPNRLCQLPVFLFVGVFRAEVLPGAFSPGRRVFIVNISPLPPFSHALIIFTTFCR